MWFGLCGLIGRWFSVFVTCLGLSGIDDGLVFVWLWQVFLGLELLCAVVIALSICFVVCGFWWVGVWMWMDLLVLGTWLLICFVCWVCLLMVSLVILLVVGGVFVVLVIWITDSGYVAG